MRSYVHSTFGRKEGKHNFHGSLVRHIAVERITYQIVRPTNLLVRILHKSLLYKLSRVLFEILWGLNCGFSLIDEVCWASHFLLDYDFHYIDGDVYVLVTVFKS